MTRVRSDSGSPMPALNPSHVWLSSTVSVAKYQELERMRDRIAIAKFVSERFTNRYLDPLEVNRAKKSGFTLLAVSCLMIEALESFSRGWPNTDHKSELAFCSFFARWPEFVALRPHSSTFYRHIRCSILHQAETTDGWRIWRRGQLFDAKQKTVNATAFLNALRSVLCSYCKQLENEPWNSEIWKSFRKKMATVCRNALGL
jgi:hypothetical protein